MTNAYTDSVTGARVRALTTGPGDDDLPYQTHPRWTPGMTHLVFSSKRTGGERRPHALDMATGQIACLVREAPDDWTLARAGSRVLWRRGDGVFATDVAAPDHNEPLASFAGLTAKHPISLSIDATGQQLYVGVTLDDKKKWGLARLDLARGAWDVFAEVNFQVGHVQANPSSPGIVMFCHETGGDAPQRTWVMDANGGGFRPFYRETFDEWVTHEVWWARDAAPCDRALFTIWPYDEAHARQPHGVASADLATGTLTEHGRFRAWHTHGSPDGRWIVADDMDRNVWLIRADSGERRLLTQGHNGPGFQTHPHPSITPDSRAVVFNSSKNGTASILLAEIPEWSALPELPHAGA